MADEDSFKEINPDTLSVLDGKLPEHETEKIDPSGDTVDKADKFHSALSTKISSSADWFDSFFRDERVEIEENKTSLRLKFYGFYERGETVDIKVKGRFRFVMPHLEDKLHLLVSSVQNEDDSNNEYFDLRDEDVSRSTYVSLRYFFKTAARENISLRGGVKFDGFSPELYFGPRFNFSKKWGSWNYRFIQTFTYLTRDGLESETSFNAEKSFSDLLFFRMGFMGDWYEKEKGYFYSINADLFGTISENRMINYRLGTDFETYPKNRLKEVLIAIRYRQRFLKKWLFFEITPQIVFRHKHYKDPAPGILISIEGLFGKDFEKKEAKHM